MEKKIRNQEEKKTREEKIGQAEHQNDVIEDEEERKIGLTWLSQLCSLQNSCSLEDPLHEP